MASPQVVDAEVLPKKLAEFINTWPLYSPFELRFESPMGYVPDLPRTILRDCSTCEAMPTWMRRNPTNDHSPQSVYVGVGQIVSYRCSHCGKEEVRVWFDFSESRVKNKDEAYSPIAGVTLRKLGQWPAQRIEPSRELAKGLTEPVLDLFKKGLTSLTHGFGLGALAYFRRVVEDASAELIDLFADRAGADGDSETAQAIRAAEQNSRMEDRLKVASEALPPTLRPGGVNPLAVLYAHYSRGIHGLSDEECLTVAQQLLFALQYIFENWKKQMEEAAQFRLTVQQWSNPKKTPERPDSRAKE